MGIIGLGIKKIFFCYILHIHDLGVSKSEYMEKGIFKVTTKCKICGKTYIDYVGEKI